MADEKIPIRSFKNVYRRDWRIYRVDKWRLPVPVPLFMVLWTIVALAIVFIASRVPGSRDLLRLIPDSLVWFAIPVGIGILMSRAAPDGRTPRRFIASMISFHLRPHQRSAGRTITWRAGSHASLPVRSDQFRPDLAKGRIHGPVVVKLPEEMVISDIFGNPKRKKARPKGAGRMGDFMTEVTLNEGETLEISP